MSPIAAATIAEARRDYRDAVTHFSHYEFRKELNNVITAYCQIREMDTDLSREVIKGIKADMYALRNEARKRGYTK